MKIILINALMVFHISTYMGGAVERDSGETKITPSSLSAEKFTINIGTYTKEYPIVSPKDNHDVKIVYISDFSDNYEMLSQAAISLVQKLKGKKLLDDIEAVVVPGDKANVFGTLVYQEIRKYREPAMLSTPEFCIVRSAEKDPPFKSIKYASITGGNKMLHLREDHYNRIKNKKVLLLDDVVSTGGTLKALTTLVEESCGCSCVAYACIAVEGEPRDNFQDKPLVSLVTLPVYIIKDS